MKIKKITLKNYKFHHNLNFNITQNNCLIYGENGTGKSSIYKALYSNLYYFKDNKIVTNQINIKEKFIHRDFSNENLEVNIELNNNHLNRENNSLNNAEILESQTIYFADEKLFHKITKNDFYQVINSELIKHFPQLKELDSIYRTIRTGVTRSTVDEHEDLVRNRQEADRIFKEKFQEQVPLDEINTIIQSLDENFEIDFEVIDSNIQFDAKKFIAPRIAIKVKDVDDKGDFINHFNEGKLKLISIAIYFALAKKYEVEDSDLKLLVLDDFLTSLDMSNRKLIIQYVLENFGDYQKIVLTHNLQFYNMIVRLLKLRKKNDNKEELTDWDIKNIFLKEVDTKEFSVISDRNEDYLKKAQEELSEYNLEISGNFLRKEFERIATEFEQLLELGRVEELDKILKALVNLDYVFAESPTKILYNSFPEKMQQIKNILEPSSQSDDSKLTQVRDEINNFETLVRVKRKTFDTSYLKSIILKTEFYKDILMNYASHDDTEKELYQKEFKKAIELLKALKNILNELK